jgi:hypothetical protein
MRDARTIRDVAREAGAWRIVGNALALIGILAMVYGAVFGVLGAIVETQEQRAEVVSDG